MTVSVKYDRSEHDSPTLWLSVLAGSLVVHLLVLLLGRWYFLRPSSSPQGSRSSIEFVEVTPVPTAPSVPPKSQSTSAPTAPRPPTSSQATSTPPQRQIAPSLPKTVEPPIETPIQPRVNTPPTPTASPRPNNPPQASPRPSSSIPAQPSPPQASEQPPQPSTPMPPASTGTPSPSAGSSPAPSATTAPNPSNSGGTTPGGASSGGTSSGPATGFPLPPAPDTSLPPVPNSSGSTPIGKAPVGSDPAPASFSVTVGLGEQPPDSRVEGPSKPGVKEIPDEIAQPKETTQKIETSAVAGECLLKPEAKNYYTKTVKLRLAIDEQGKVIGEPFVLQSSGNGAYDELAQCVIRRWEFFPAYNVVDDKKNAVPSNLDVPVRIDPK